MNEVDKLTGGLFESSEFDEDSEYLKRGRPYSAVPDDVVKAKWADAFRRMVSHPSKEASEMLGDCSAELRRRRLEPPIHEIQPDLAKLQEEIRKDPNNPGVQEAIAEFMRKLRKPDA